MGLLRILLALAVMFSHAGKVWSIEFMNAGIAVHSFFIVSGFYIALALDQKYVGNRANYVFYVNRYLRLWPTYAISLALIFLHYFHHKAVGALFAPILNLPPFWEFFVLFSNLSFIGIDLFTHISIGTSGAVFSEYGVDPKQTGFSLILNGPVWSIWVEMLFYISAPFIVRSLRRSLIFLIIGIVYVVALRFLPPQLANSYRFDLYYPYFFPFFGIGAVVYWVSRPGYQAQNYAYLIGAFVVIGYLAMPLYLGSTYYLMLAMAIPKLFELTKDLKWDKFLGDLAYPIYILHMPIHVMTNEWKLIPVVPLQTATLTLAMSILTVWVVERPVSRAREKWTAQKLARK
jgi:peptidoglycan/LPS O-acetylase OafA/YrhL